MYYKVPFNKMVLRSFVFSDVAFHYLFDVEKFSLCFHEGDELIAFLTEKGVDHIEYRSEMPLGEDPSTLLLGDGREIELKYGWITTGYEYGVYEKGRDEPIEVFAVPKGGKIRFDPVKDKVSIAFTGSGDANDQQVKKALKSQSQSKSIGCIVGGGFIILAIIAFYYFGQLLNWLGIGS